MPGFLVPRSRPFSRRALVASGAATVAGLGFVPAILARQQATPAAPNPDDLVAIARQAMDAYALRSTLLQVTIDGDIVARTALGESMTGQPATIDMRFRNGAVAISLLSTLLLLLVEDGIVGLDDMIDGWLPDLPASDTATLRMLANMTAGYRDHVQNPRFLDDTQADPFRDFSPDDLIAYSLEQPRLFEPGTNWEYSHSGYIIMGLALEAATGRSIEQLMQERVLDPLGLTETVADQTAAIPDPVLHAFSAERRGFLGIAPDAPFYEESTFWNPSWTVTRGAVQTMSIRDFAAAMVAVGEGTLLSEESSAAQLDRGLLGFGTPVDGCFSCHTLDEHYVYGLGVVWRGPWLLQNPLFSGCSGVSAYLPERKISVALVNTYAEDSYDETGALIHGNASVPLFAAIADYLAPDLATPMA